MQSRFNFPRVFFVFLMLCSIEKFAWARKCFHVSSYEPSHPWAAGINEAVEIALKGKCDLTLMSLDTKRNPSISWGERMGDEAFAKIQKMKPDIIILSDDNATRYVAMRHLKESQFRFVFTGINWTAEEYGYPWKNCTGLIES